MILIVIYIVAGLYFMLMAMGLLHREFVSTMNRARRNGLMVLGAGFFLQIGRAHV